MVVSSPEMTIIRDTKALLRESAKIQSLADSERDALGFWPEQQLKDAIHRGRLWAAFDGDHLAGYLVFSGVFPNAKVQAIATTPTARTRGVASYLLRHLVSELERLGYLSIKAEVAADLTVALKFYESHGFRVSHTKPGGRARNRNIIVHVRELDNPSLFSAIGSDRALVDLGIRRRSAGDSPLYALDLNVYLDLAKERKQSEQARDLFGSALAHKIRLVVANEFVTELERNTGQAPSGDPILSLARRLPKIPSVEPEALRELSNKVYELVFGAPTGHDQYEKRKLSDSKHIAHAALARVSAFVTRDGALLAARNALLTQIGIDTISLQELVDLLPARSEHPNRVPASIGVGFEVVQVERLPAAKYLDSLGVTPQLTDLFFPTNPDDAVFCSRAVAKSDALVALGALTVPSVMQPVARLLVCVSSEDPNCDFFADHLLELLTRSAAANGPIALELANVPGQTTVNTLALARGFMKSAPGNPLHKVVLGQPLTRSTWSNLAKRLQRQTGLKLASEPPNDQSAEIELTSRAGTEFSVRLRSLENILSPALVVVGGNDGALVPIRRKFADELLGTRRQSNLPFIEDKHASFARHRSYVNSPRMSSVMLPERVILFYESLADGGRGAVTAVARITDTIVIQKGDIPNQKLRQLVVDDVGDFSSTDEVLLTSFDNLFELPRPVALQHLRQIGAIDKSNLVSAARVSSEIVARILDFGWMND
jgi:GNAT superfamily N-acetyltransferase